MSANISESQLRKELDKLFSVVTGLTQEVITLKAIVATGNVTVGGNATVAGTLGVTGATTLNGGLVTFAADDSGGAGFRNVLVPNA